MIGFFASIATFATLAQAQEGIGLSVTPSTAAIGWMNSAASSYGSQGLTTDVRLTPHIEEAFAGRTYTEICNVTTQGSVGGTETFVAYELLSDGSLGDLVWYSDAVDLTASGEKCALLGDDGGTITTEGAGFFNANDELELFLLEGLAIGRFKSNPVGEKYISNPRYLGSDPANIDGASYSGWVVSGNTSPPPADASGATLTNTSTARVPLIVLKQ